MENTSTARSPCYLTSPLTAENSAGYQKFLSPSSATKLLSRPTLAFGVDEVLLLLLPAGLLLLLLLGACLARLVTVSGLSTTTVLFVVEWMVSVPCWREAVLCAAMTGDGGGELRMRSSAACNGGQVRGRSSSKTKCTDEGCDLMGGKLFEQMLDYA